MVSSQDVLSEEQKEYLAGFAVGAGLVPSNRVSAQSSPPPHASIGASAVTGPDRLLAEAQESATQGGRKLVNEEVAKREKHPLDRWSELVARAESNTFPSGVDVFLGKSFGMFYVAPAQNSYMCRLRLAGGCLTSHQLAGIADIADQHAGQYAHVTTRANLQLREIPASKPPEILSQLADLGILTRGSGGDNIRNITASPTAGFDPQEWIDTLPLARQMQQYISNHREMYHLPRKFNIAFDGGGVVSTLADTNDIGFQVVRVGGHHATAEVATGTYFRVQLAGITGHRQFASDCGWMVSPEQCVHAAAAIVRVFIRHGNRTDRKQARLKYLIDEWGMERFLRAVSGELPFEPLVFPLESCELPPAPRPGSHLGFHAYRDDRYYVGVALPVGALSSTDMRRLADIASRYGDGQLRLTCWQNVLIPGIHRDEVDLVKGELTEGGFSWDPHPVRAGLVACTGNAGCKFAASDTKRHALQIAECVEERVELDQPVNIHLTGCHHSCAQHYIGDIGLIAAKVEVPRVAAAGGDKTNTEPDEDEIDETDEVEGYHLLVGGGFSRQQGLGRELLRDIPAADVPRVVEQVLAGYLCHRQNAESFVDFTRRCELADLRNLLGIPEPTASC